MSDQYGQGPAGVGSDHPQNIATAITEISERASLLVREEIELAKAELRESANRMIQGTIVGVISGIFLVMALILALVGGAWVIYYELPVNVFAYFWGFFAMAAVCVVFGAVAGYLASRAVKRASPPVPKMAIEEARKTRDAVAHAPDGTVQVGSGSYSVPGGEG